MRRFAVLAMAAALLLTGCSMFDGQYVRITPHRVQTSQTEVETISAESFQQLYDVLKDMTAQGRESFVISMSDYPSPNLEQSLDTAEDFLRRTDPLAAYVVEDVEFDLGTSAGNTAVAVTMHYRRSIQEIQSVARVADMGEATGYILSMLESCSPKAVFLVDTYRNMDLTQLVQDLVQGNPKTIMEMPQVSQGVYGVGSCRLVELTFSYENSRDALRQMCSQVRPVFDSAALYVSGGGKDSLKLSQLYAFLMERFAYKVETSITPSYSLLCHGVGDSKAFATVFAAMCREAGLTCNVVTGTRNGEPWTWNMVLVGDTYKHLDLLRCRQGSGFQTEYDNEMIGYVWDYSANPPSVAPNREPETTEEAAGTEEETLPEATELEETLPVETMPDDAEK